MAEEIQATTIYWGTAQTASTEEPPWYVLPYGAETFADEEGRGVAATTKIKGCSWEVEDRVLLAKIRMVGNRLRAGGRNCRRPARFRGLQTRWI